METSSIVQSLVKAHCKGKFPREFAYKPMPHEELIKLHRISNVKSLEAMIKYVELFANKLGEYTSVYSYEDTNDYTTARVDRLYFDFDCKPAPQHAIVDAQKTMDALYHRGIQCIPYFSGEKGIGLYIDFPEVQIAPGNKKRVIEKFWHLVNGSLGLHLPTLDGGSLIGDIARVSRLPGSLHHSGLYCTPLYYEDLLKGIQHIHRLAKEIRDYDLDAYITCNKINNNHCVPHILSAFEEMVIQENIIQEEETARRKKSAESKFNNQDANEISGNVSPEEIRIAKAIPLSIFMANSRFIKCPFHVETQASLSINHRKNLWYCHGCGKGGTVIDFVMMQEGISFQSAVKQLLRLGKHSEKV